KPVVHLNWSIRGKIAGLKPPKELAGTKWQLGTDPKFAEVLEFADDGEFKVTVPSSSGGKPTVKTGTWKAEGDVITATAQVPGKRGTLAEYRGRYVKNELWVRSRTEFDPGDGGATKFGVWITLPIGQTK